MHIVQKFTQMYKQRIYKLLSYTDFKLYIHNLQSSKPSIEMGKKTATLHVRFSHWVFWLLGQLHW